MTARRTGWRLTGPLLAVMLALGMIGVTAPGARPEGAARPVQQAVDTDVAPVAGYVLAGAGGDAFAYGLESYGTIASRYGVRPTSPVVGMAESIDGQGYFLVTSDGTVYTFGDAHYRGDTAGLHLDKPIVGMALDPLTDGYWLVASDGGIFAFGAPFEGSAGALPLTKPIVGMALDPLTDGYWLVASDGGIFSYNAAFHGSAGGIHLTKPVVGMATTPTGTGYWLVASDGGIFSYNAPFEGSAGAIRLAQPIVGMAADGVTGGYWLAASDGGIFSYDAPFNGSAGGGPLAQPIVGMGAAAIPGPGSLPVAPIPTPPSPPMPPAPSPSSFAPVILTNGLPEGTVGQPYGPVTLTATGGTAPYTWSLAAGSALPPGITLSPAGVLDGTPTAAGTTLFTLVVTDADGRSDVATDAAIYVGPEPASIASTTEAAPSVDGRAVKARL